jgi:hypothetical protein
MFQEAFEKLELADIATILDRINPALEGATFDPVETTILSLPIHFYKGYQLLDIADNTVMPAIKRYALYSLENFVVLDFTNKPIYKLNQQAPLQLNPDTVSDYVRFFFSFVRGKHGRFLIVENVDDIHWKDEPPPNARKAISKMVVPVAILEEAKNGDFALESTMVFKGALFKTNIAVQKNGTVTIKNEELLVEDMPVLDDAFGQ